MAVAQRTVRDTEFPPHRVLREILRHYIEFREQVNQGGDHVLEHSYLARNSDGSIDKKTVAVSFWDLHRGMKDLAPRKLQALYLNVILDKKQKDVAEIMGITTVSVGQYVKAATIQLAKQHFGEDYEYDE